MLLVMLRVERAEVLRGRRVEAARLLKTRVNVVGPAVEVVVVEMVELLLLLLVLLVLLLMLLAMLLEMGQMAMRQGRWRRIRSHHDGGLLVVMGKQGVESVRRLVQRALGSLRKRSLPGLQVDVVVVEVTTAWMKKPVHLSPKYPKRKDD